MKAKDGGGSNMFGEGREEGVMVIAGGRDKEGFNEGLDGGGCFFLFFFLINL